MRFIVLVIRDICKVNNNVFYKLGSRWFCGNSLGSFEKEDAWGSRDLGVLRSFLTLSRGSLRVGNRRYYVFLELGVEGEKSEWGKLLEISCKVVGVLIFFFY